MGFDDCVVTHVDEVRAVEPDSSPVDDSFQQPLNQLSETTVARTWIVIPAYNEEARIGEVLSGLRSRGLRNIVVVDDGSGDATAQLAASHDIWVLKHIVNRGQGAALQTGIDFAVSRGGEIIVTFDADGQHVADDIARLIEPIENGEAEVALGSRFLGSAPGVPKYRKWLLKVAVLGTRMSTGLRLTDTHNGLRAMTSQASRKLRMAEDGMAHASEFLGRLADSKLPWREVPVTIHYTEHSLAKGQTNSAAFHIAFRMFIARVVR